MGCHNSLEESSVSNWTQDDVISQVVLWSLKSTEIDFPLCCHGGIIWINSRLQLAWTFWSLAEKFFRHAGNMVHLARVINKAKSCVKVNNPALEKVSCIISIWVFLFCCDWWPVVNQSILGCAELNVWMLSCQVYGQWLKYKYSNQIPSYWMQFKESQNSLGWMGSLKSSSIHLPWSSMSPTTWSSMQSDLEHFQGWGHLPPLHRERCASVSPPSL